MAIAALAVGYLLLFEREHTEEAPTVPTLVTAFDPEVKIQAIEITYNGTNTIRAAQSGEQWHLDTTLPHPPCPRAPTN